MADPVRSRALALAVGRGQVCARVAQVSDNVEGPGPPRSMPAVKIDRPGALALPSESVNRAGHVGLGAGRRSFRRDRSMARRRLNAPANVIACRVPMIPPPCRRFHRISPPGQPKLRLDAGRRRPGGDDDAGLRAVMQPGWVPSREGLEDHRAERGARIRLGTAEADGHASLPGCCLGAGQAHADQVGCPRPAVVPDAGRVSEEADMPAAAAPVRTIRGTGAGIAGKCLALYWQNTAITGLGRKTGCAPRVPGRLGSGSGWRAGQVSVARSARSTGPLADGAEALADGLGVREAAAPGPGDAAAVHPARASAPSSAVAPG